MEGGERRCRYAFNFIQETARQKGTAHAIATGSSLLSSAPVPSVGDSRVGVKCKKNTVGNNGHETLQGSAARNRYHSGEVYHARVHEGQVHLPNSIFLGTQLTVGMTLETVNGECSSFEEGNGASQKRGWKDNRGCLPPPMVL
ncbi:hypothetical protein ACHAW5_000643 [Stephanodiscus triporus]|uniref:Uncharacterized protein n=1 Tax=Stephanodiscus triporus TaxID=2934178 RepID=A0ABD3MK76_9STRA